MNVAMQQEPRDVSPPTLKPYAEQQLRLFCITLDRPQEAAALPQGTHLTEAWVLSVLTSQGIYSYCRAYSSVSAEELADTLCLLRLLQAFRSRGHLAANLDPLQRQRGPWFREGLHASPWRWGRGAPPVQLCHLSTPQ